jgi:hypothetical protein
MDLNMQKWCIRFFFRRSKIIEERAGHDMTSSKGRASRSTPSLFSPGGEMRDRARAFDWSKTPVGPVAEWQHSVRTAVSICLCSGYPAVMWWRHSAFTTFYNDAYIPIFGLTKP